MEFRELKQSVEKIEMSDEMQNRIIKNCRLSAVHELEESTMKTRVKCGLFPGQDMVGRRVGW